jgi:hypothetical protein
MSVYERGWLLICTGITAGLAIAEIIREGTVW